MSLLLPQTRAATIVSMNVLDIHGDRYVDLSLVLNESDAPPVRGRVSAMECPPDLKPGDRVSVKFTMGVITSVTRA